MININFTPFPTLTTARLKLRQLSINDKQQIFALRSNEEINRYLNRQPSTTIEDAAEFINKINNNIEKNISVYWAITLADTGSFAGTICLFDFSTEKDSCEIGYELMTAFQGQGIMQEAAAKVIGYAFDNLQVQQVKACTHRHNQRSTKLLEKLNFIQSAEGDKENADLDVFSLSFDKA